MRTKITTSIFIKTIIEKEKKVVMDWHLSSNKAQAYINENDVKVYRVVQINLAFIRFDTRNL